MDFHSLSRKELQALCKKNKIPANMTNVAMADALKALEMVEGLDEITNVQKSDSQQSPEKTVSGSPDIPRTACRTSTRRNPVCVEPDSSQHLSHTRRSTRRTVAQMADQESKNTNPTETPSMPASRRRGRPSSARCKTVTQAMECRKDDKLLGLEKSDAPETPVTQSCCKRAHAISARSKKETQKKENFVQMTYSTRRSVRLLEKSMEDLSLKEKGEVEHAKLDGLCKCIEDGMEKNAAGEDLPTLSEVSEVSIEKSDDSEVLSCRNLDLLLENESEMKCELQEDIKSNDSEVHDCNAKLEMSCDSEKSDCLDNLSRLDAEGEEKNKSSDESIDKNGLDVLITEKSEIVNADPKSERQKDLSGNQDCLAVEAPNASCTSVMKTEYNSIDMSLEEVSDEAMDQVLAAKFVSSDRVHNSVNIEESTLKVSKIVSESSDMKLTEDEQEDNHDLQSKFAFEEESDGNRSDDVQETDNAETVQEQVSILPKDVGYEKLDSRNEPENPKSILHPESCRGVSDLSVTNSHPTSELLDCNDKASSKDLSIEPNIESLFDVDVIEAKEFGMKIHDNDTSSDSDKTLGSDSEGKHENPETLGDESAEEFAMSSYECPLTSSDSDKTQGSDSERDHGDPETLGDESADEFAMASYECHLTSSDSPGSDNEGKHDNPETLVDESADEFAMASYECPLTLDKTPTSKKQTSPYQHNVSVRKVSFAADTLQGQFPRPTITTPTISSTKKQTDINKENIDNNAKIVVPKKDVAMTKVINEEISEDISLRKLTKMLREKLQIANKKNEEKDVLSHIIPVAETENKNT